jgi:hypothetical protein
VGRLDFKREFSDRLLDEIEELSDVMVREIYARTG